MKRVLIWYSMLHKRLLKKVGFLLILLLIPMLTILTVLTAKEDSGLLHIALAAKDPTDPFAAQIIGELSTDSSILRYTRCDTEEQATALVESGKADAAWVLQEDLNGRMDRVAKGEEIPLAEVIYTEDNMFVKASRERLFGGLFSHLSYRIYEAYVLDLGLPVEAITPDKLQKTYELFVDDREMVEFQTVDAKVLDFSGEHYLTSPLRGLLMTVMLLCGLAATLYFRADEQKRVFSNLPPSRRIWVFFGNNMAALSIAGVFVMVALILSGQVVSVGWEILLMVLFVLMTTGFCTLLGTAIRSPRTLSLTLPVLLVLTLAFCPIFVNITVAPWLQAFLPPYLYLRGGGGEGWVMMLVYILVGWSAAYGLYRIRYRHGEKE